MRSRTRPATRLFSRDEWRPWFAWRPKRVPLGPQLPSNYIQPYQWVWWETIARIRNIGDAYIEGKGYDRWRYRIEPPSVDETPCSSADSNQSGDEE